MPNTVKSSVFIAALWMCLLPLGSTETLLCSQCDSDTDATCESSPPMASPCKESGKLVCSTARETSSKGEFIRFIRFCSILKTVEKDCITRDTGVKVCYETCDTDGCNASSHLHGNIVLLLGVIVTSLVELFRNTA